MGSRPFGGGVQDLWGWGPGPFTGTTLQRLCDLEVRQSIPTMRIRRTPATVSQASPNTKQEATLRQSHTDRQEY